MSLNLATVEEVRYVLVKIFEIGLKTMAKKETLPVIY